MLLLGECIAFLHSTCPSSERESSPYLRTVYRSSADRVRQVLEADCRTTPIVNSAAMKLGRNRLPDAACQWLPYLDME